MLQNLNAEQSWHQGDSEYTEPIEMIAVVTESLTGAWLGEVFWQKSRGPYCCVEQVGALEKYHVLMSAQTIHIQIRYLNVVCLEI